MMTEVGSTVHPRYQGIAEWRVKSIARLPRPIQYTDPVQGSVSYDPKIVWLESSTHSRVLWFAYWISTDKTKGNLQWGGGAPMLEEAILLRLLKDAIAKGIFTKSFLKKLKGELDTALGC
jgi:hypothetical protein